MCQQIVQGYVSSLEAQQVEVEGLLRVLVVDVFDSQDELEKVLGISMLEDKRSRKRYDHEDFSPYWEAFVEHENWFEILLLVGDGGEGWVVLIPKAIVDVELRELCSIHARPA